MYQITIIELLNPALQSEIAKSYTINAYLILQKDKFFYKTEYKTSKQGLEASSKFTKSVNSYFASLGDAIKRLETNNLENCLIVRI